MATFLRLNLERPIYYMEAAPPAPAELPAPPVSRAALEEKALGFMKARTLAGDLGGRTVVLYIKAGGLELRTAFGAGVEAIPAEDEIGALVREAEELGAEGRRARASARYQGDRPYLRLR